jgi:glyoxylase-like metal-dependent hydrolase (beta-lactamase superfamily II)
VQDEVGPGVYRLTQGVANFYLIEDGGKLVLVDAGGAKDWHRFAQLVQELGRRVTDLDAVLLTHAHGDHVGFAEQARVTAEAQVWVHESDEQAARTGKTTGGSDGSIGKHLLHAQLYRTIWILGRAGAGRIVPVAEVSTFGDGQVLDVPGSPRIIAVPGHTDGSAALLLEDRKILFSGDAVVTLNPASGRRGPQIQPSVFNRDSQQALRSLDNLAGLDADTVLTGHGEPWTGGVAEAIRLAKASGTS